MAFLCILPETDLSVRSRKMEDIKAVNVYFSKKEIIDLKKLKGKQSWHDFIIRLSKQNTLEVEQ